MLHNNGAYGPNDNPVNGSPPLDLPQMSTPLNIGQNLQNTGGIAQQATRGHSGNYSLPNFSTYDQQNLDMRSHLNSFSNHHLKNFQPQYMLPNSTSLPNTGWPNGVSPLNLNAQSTYVPNMLNFHANYEKRQHNYNVTPSNDKEPISQLPNNLNSSQTSHSIPKTITSVEDSLYNSNLNQFNHYNHHFVPNNQERIPMDVSKRRSLENTVKLIENIIINTTKEDSQRNETATNKNQINTEKTPNSEQSDSSSDSTESNNKNENNDKRSTENNNTDETEKITTTNVKTIQSVTTTEIKNKESFQNNQTTPKIQLKDLKVKIEIEIQPCPIKVEKCDELDNNYESPFLKDINGMARKDASDKRFIKSENSINEAVADMKNGSTSEVYYECPYCSLLFSHPKRFLIHTKWHTFGLLNEIREEEAREREAQKKQRREARIMDKMHAKVEKAIEEDNATFPCQDCSKIFSSKGSLKNHRTRFHSGRIRECGVCGAVCMGWAGLKAHAATHARPYRCTVCDKEFTHKHSIARHMETHIGEDDKKLHCETCGKLFAVASRLKEHMRVHARAEKGPSFRCSYCAKAFFQSYSLTIHERSHRNEKPYTCDICHASYGTNSSLKRHLKVSHSKSKPFGCTLCGRSFKCERALTAHTNKHHPSEDTQGRKRRRRPATKRKDAKNAPSEPEKDQNEEDNETEQVI